MVCRVDYVIHTVPLGNQIYLKNNSECSIRKMVLTLHLILSLIHCIIKKIRGTLIIF